MISKKGYNVTVNRFRVSGRLFGGTIRKVK